RRPAAPGGGGHRHPRRRLLRGRPAVGGRPGGCRGALPHPVPGGPGGNPGPPLQRNAPPPPAGARRPGDRRHRRRAGPPQRPAQPRPAHRRYQRPEPQGPARPSSAPVCRRSPRFARHRQPDAAVLRLQVRPAAGRRPGLRLPLAAQSLLRAGAALPHRVRSGRGGIRAAVAPGPPVRRAPGRLPALRASAARRRGPRAAGGRGGLHRRPPPVGGHRPGTGPAPGLRGPGPARDPPRHAWAGARRRGRRGPGGRRLMRWARWLMPGLRVKRWFVLFAAGILMFASGWAIIVDRPSLAALDALVRRGVAFMTGSHLPPRLGGMVLAGLGAAAVLAAVYGAYRSVTSALVPEERAGDLIVQRRRADRGPRIVALGGGTGLSTLVRGLKEYTSHVTAVVTVTDDGGSSGRLVDEL